uniref:Similar to n=2 Tax=Caenorhabditis tropicalis TaxID=1561998 RepID=A0A1I7UHT6_9PELO
MSGRMYNDDLDYPGPEDFAEGNQYTAPPHRVVTSSLTSNSPMPTTSYKGYRIMNEFCLISFDFPARSRFPSYTYDDLMRENARYDLRSTILKDVVHDHNGEQATMREFITENRAQKQKKESIRMGMREAKQILII